MSVCALSEGECGNPHPILLHIHITVVYSMYTSAHMFLCLQSLCTCDHSPTHLRWLKLSQIENSLLHIPSSIYLTISLKSRLQTLPCRFVSFHNTSILGFLVWVSVSTRCSFPLLIQTLSCLPSCRAWPLPKELRVSFLRFFMVPL